MLDELKIFKDYGLFFTLFYYETYIHTRSQYQNDYNLQCLDTYGD